MRANVANILIGAVVLLITLSLSLFIVDQRQTAIVLQLGEMVRVETAPGLKWKIPLMQNVRFFDSRILTLDAGEPERFITAEEERAGGFLRQMAHRRCEAVLHQRGRRRNARTYPFAANREFEHA